MTKWHYDNMAYMTRVTKYPFNIFIDQAKIIDHFGDIDPNIDFFSNSIRHASSPITLPQIRSTNTK